MMHDAVGIAGVVLVLAAYLLLQLGRLGAQDLRYVLMNLIGSSGILFSLTRHFNLASFLIEFAWVTISLIGLYRVLRNRRRKQ